ncbi:hypothetical protein T4E_433 [Trichinella pseudospiralis]|uniref:Uncharacterized protein n=1 Tax=Trichinella pseudospiralis TaxID=6337 RepID=A0A0V0XYA3_TRIPS|nr:hypothetical protein T4E_433 [Trichinella pseudospiralis]
MENCRMVMIVRPILPLGKSRYGKVFQCNIYGTIRVTAAMCKRATSALQQGLPPLYEVTVAALMITSISKSRHQQNGTTTSGNHVGAVVTSVAKLDMTFHPPLASLREGCGEVNVQRAFYLRPEPVPKQLERRDDLLAEGHASIHSHPDSEHPDKAGKDQGKSQIMLNKHYPITDQRGINNEIAPCIWHLVLNVEQPISEQPMRKMGRAAYK